MTRSKQDRVRDVLECTREWLTAQDIAKRTKLTTYQASGILRTLGDQMEKQAGTGRYRTRLIYWRLKTPSSSSSSSGADPDQLSAAAAARGG